ncbi:hypothetical protein ACVWXL_007934 [Bradyrhizobium sp. GM22.5]
MNARQDRHRHGEPGRQRQRKAGRPPDQPHGLVEEQDQAEGREHVVKMVSSVEMPQRGHLEHDAEHERRAERQ